MPLSHPERRPRRSAPRSLLLVVGTGLLVGLMTFALQAVIVFTESPMSPHASAEAHMPGSQAKSERVAALLDELYAERSEAVTESIDAYLDEREVRLGIVLEDLTTGRVFSYGGDEQFTTASTVKVNILAGLLLQAQDEDRELRSGERALATEMITVSGNDPADTLHARIGSSDGFADAMDRFGFEHTDPGPRGVWGSTRTTAEDQIRLLRAVATGEGPLTAESRDYIRRLMSEVVPDQAWGVSAAAGAEDAVELKNGWVPRDADDGRWAVNSIGRVYGPDRDLLIAVYSDRHDSKESGVECVEQVVADVMMGLYPEQSAEEAS